MNYCQTLFRLYGFAPSCEINRTKMILPANLPLDIWNQIFSCLEFKELKLFTEYKEKVVKLPLDGNEDINRLMMGKKFIFYKKDFLGVVSNVYNLALCCQAFYVLTERERMLLINTANYARIIDKQFFLPNPDQTPPRVGQDIDSNKLFQIYKPQNAITPSIKDLIRKTLPSYSLENLFPFKPVNLDPIILILEENFSEEKQSTDSDDII